MIENNYNTLKHSNQQNSSDQLNNFLTIGNVVDTNDPLQMGRLKISCPGFGDNPDKAVKDLPWSIGVSPLMGITAAGTRSSQNSDVDGPVAYGMWNIPSVGAFVLVGCVDGDSSNRFWIGCLSPMSLTHTMPHGRYIYAGGGTENGAPDGPLDSTENPIQPLYSNFTKAFSKNNESVPGTPSDPRRNMEWRTRGADTQVSANSEETIVNGGVLSKLADHRIGSFKYTSVTEEDGSTRISEGHGYGLSMEFPTKFVKETGGINYDSMTYSWTTPGFHSISMNDSDFNNRMRFRTSTGHQIIMDDTNERIYISTAEGNTWVELDKCGNIDIYSGRNLSVHAQGDINMTTDQAFRVTAHNGIHLHSNTDIRLSSVNDTHIQSSGTLKLHSKSSLNLQTDADMHQRSADSFRILSSGGTMNIRSSENTLITGAEIHLNGPDAAPADNAEEKSAFLTSRVPEHEPWARTFMNPASSDTDGPSAGGQQNKHEPEYSYTDPNIGRKSSREKDNYNRGPLWHR